MAGVNFFGSRGVVLTDYKSGEENLFSLIDVTGAPTARPTSISMSILNLLEFDYASCFRLTASGGIVEKDEYSATGGEAIADNTLTVDGTIAADVPGKTLGGTVVIQDVSDNGQEYVLRYSSYAAATGVVTLANKTSTMNGASTTTTIVHDTGATFTTEAKVGDLLYNTQGGGAGRGYAYVKSVDSDTQLTLDRAITGQVQNDAYELNCIPVSVDTADNVYFMIIFEFKEADGSASASMQYIADIYSRVRVRNTSDATIKIKGYTTDATIGTGGGTASATRIENTVYGS